MLLTIFWGGSYIAISYSLEALPPLLSAALRVAGGGAILAVVALSSKKKWPSSSVWVPAMIAGLFVMGIPWALLYWGETRVNPALGGVLIGTMPLWTRVFVPVFHPEQHNSKWQWLGISLGFFGVLLLFVPRFQNNLYFEVAGMGAILLAAVGYGLGTSYIQGITDKMTGAQLLSVQAPLSCVFLIIISLLTETWPSLSFVMDHPRAIYSVVYLIVCSTALAFLFFFRLIREWGSISASTVTYAVPFVAVLLDALLLGIMPDEWVVVGLFLIVGGVVITQRTGLKRSKQNGIHSDQESAGSSGAVLASGAD